jgi:hypothetical protein
LVKKKSEITEKVFKIINTKILNEFKFKSYIFLIMFGKGKGKDIPVTGHGGP